jgi:hypothetical protein
MRTRIEELQVEIALHEHKYHTFVQIEEEILKLSFVMDPLQLARESVLSAKRRDFQRRFVGRRLCWHVREARFRPCRK